MSMRGFLFVVIASAVTACAGSAPPPVMVEMSVTAKPAILAGKDLTRSITDDDVEAIRTHRDVVRATPRARLQGAARGRGSFDGHEVSFELSGSFTDGIPVEVVADEPELAARFVDLDPKAAPGARVPVLVSPELIELYNQQYATANDLPRMEANLTAFVATRKPLTFTISIGASMTGGAAEATPALEVEAVVAGISRHAQPRGITVPIGYVTAWNRALGRSESTFSSVDVRLRDARALETFDRWLGEKRKLVAGPATVVRTRAP